MICFDDGICIHGAFKKKADAQAKAKQRKGRVKFVNIRGSWRYLVVSQKRKKR